MTAVGVLVAATGAEPATAAPVVGPVPANLVGRYRLDTRWYGKYIDGGGVPVFGPHQIEDATLLRVGVQLQTLLATAPTSPVAEPNRRNVRIVIIARGEYMSSIRGQHHGQPGRRVDVDVNGPVGGNGVHNNIATARL